MDEAKIPTVFYIGPIKVIVNPYMPPDTFCVGTAVGKELFETGLLRRSQLVPECEEEEPG